MTLNLDELRDKIRKIIYTWQFIPDDDPNGPEVYPCERFVYYDSGVTFHTRLHGRLCASVGISAMLPWPGDLEKDEFKDYLDTIESIADEVWFEG